MRGAFRNVIIKTSFNIVKHWTSHIVLISSTSIWSQAEPSGAQRVFTSCVDLRSHTPANHWRGEKNTLKTFWLIFFVSGWKKSAPDHLSLAESGEFEQLRVKPSSDVISITVLWYNVNNLNIHWIMIWWSSQKLPHHDCQTLMIHCNSIIPSKLLWAALIKKSFPSGSNFNKRNSSRQSKIQTFAAPEKRELNWSHRQFALKSNFPNCQ